MMNWVKMLFSAILLLALSINAFAAELGSATYNQNVVVSSGSQNSSSASYTTNIAVGIINGIITSASYINNLGFFHILLLANDQPCTSASQCEGGFCCSSLCKSSSCPSGGGGVSGGGGAASAGGGGGSLPKETPKTSDFSISTSSITEKLVLGDLITKAATIKNTGDLPISFGLKVLSIDNFISLSDSVFTLEPGKEKTVNVILTGRKVGSYIGEIQITGNGIARSINIVADIKSELSLFDVKLDIPSAYQEVGAGDEIREQITLLNIGPSKQVDVTATYIIKDRYGNYIEESSETFAVEKQKSYIKSFKLPNNIPIGDYLSVVEIRYDKSVAVSSELFKVAPQKETGLQKFAKSNKLLLYVFAAFVGFILLFMYLLLPKEALFERFGK